MILDVERDRYLLSRADVADWSEASQAAGLRVDPTAASWRPAGTLWPGGPAPLAAAALGLLELHRISTLLDRRAFGGLVASVAAAPVRPGGTPRAPEGLIAAFEAARPLFPRPRVCRLDAPALCLLFRRYGQPAHLVFGARLEPFAAHCWAELEGKVLNEPVEAVTAFTPILVL